MKLFFYRETGGNSRSNLQLFSLIQAERYWQEVRKHYEPNKENTPKLLEYYVFIIACLGMSLTQLLGQNYSKVRKDLPDPSELLSDILMRATSLPRPKKKSLRKEFDELIKIYNKCRHFGVTAGDETHLAVAALTFDSILTHVETTYKIWDTVIALFEENPENDLGELKDLGTAKMVREIIKFGDHEFDTGG